jgi:O-antigen/teichoic acid export membrane protein
MQQAYFSLSMQIASASLLITASYIKIFWKEIAQLFHDEKREEAITLYKNSRIIVFNIGAAISGAIIPWSGEIIAFVYGVNYIGATSILMLLALYSVHQTLGQLDSAFLMATTKTNVGLRFGLLLFPLGFLVAFILLSNLSIGSIKIGMELGASGLALKMVFMQYISVKALAYFIGKEFNFRLESMYQIRVVAVFLIIGYFSKWLISAIGTIYLGYLIAMGLYLLISLFLVVISPKTFNLKDIWIKKISEKLSVYWQNEYKK